MLDPSVLRKEVLAQKYPLVIIDEIQKVPELLDEIHWCIENTKTRFILCGSSARKLRHGAANLLGGRAWRFELFPLTTEEILTCDLERAINHGMLPDHYLAEKPDQLLKGYTSDYLQEEIRAEALVRDVPAFARFLEAVAATHGQLVNYSNIARDCGVSSHTVREYYQILEDTLLGHRLPPWKKSQSRRLIETEKFFLFDTGVVRTLKGISRIEPQTDEFGRAFEHLLIEEVRAYLSYSTKDLPLSFWRTSTGLEVDLIVGDLEVAIEFKSSGKLQNQNVNGLKALLEERSVKKALLVCMIKSPRQIADNILALPWQDFCKRLWKGEIV